MSLLTRYIGLLFFLLLYSACMGATMALSHAHDQQLSERWGSSHAHAVSFYSNIASTLILVAVCTAVYLYISYK